MSSEKLTSTAQASALAESPPEADADRRASMWLANLLERGEWVRGTAPDAVEVAPVRTSASRRRELDRVDRDLAKAGI